MNLVRSGHECAFRCGSCSTFIAQLTAMTESISHFGGVSHGVFMNVENVQIREGRPNILVPSRELVFAEEECTNCHKFLGVRIMSSDNAGVQHLFPVGTHCLIINLSQSPP